MGTLLLECWQSPFYPFVNVECPLYPLENPGTQCFSNLSRRTPAWSYLTAQKWGGKQVPQRCRHPGCEIAPWQPDRSSWSLQQIPMKIWQLKIWQLKISQNIESKIIICHYCLNEKPSEVVDQVHSLLLKIFMIVKSAIANAKEESWFDWHMLNCQFCLNSGLGHSEGFENKSDVKFLDCQFSHFSQNNCLLEMLISFFNDFTLLSLFQLHTMAIWQNTARSCALFQWGKAIQIH